MSCGNCVVCDCDNNSMVKLNGYYIMLSYVYGVTFEEKNTNFIIKYNENDGYYEVHPHYEKASDFEVIMSIKEKDTGLIFDEHGKLIAGFEYSDKHFVSQVFHQNKGSKLFGEVENTVTSNFEDYRLKRLISRYVTLLNTYGVTKEVKHNYGSTELEHILWMLKSIYSKKSRSLLERYMFLGYIQGVLKSKNLIDVRHERDVMHELF